MNHLINMLADCDPSDVRWHVTFSPDGTTVIGITINPNSGKKEELNSTIGAAMSNDFMIALE